MKHGVILNILVVLAILGGTLGIPVQVGAQSQPLSDTASAHHAANDDARIADNIPPRLGAGAANGFTRAPFSPAPGRRSSLRPAGEASGDGSGGIPASMAYDDPLPTFQFDRSAYSAGEADGSATITVTLSASPAQSATVAYQAWADLAWRARASMSTARLNPGVVADNSGKVYAVGGWDEAGQQELATVEAYDPATNSWTGRADLPPCKRRGWRPVTASSTRLGGCTTTLA